jgi:hypothetical protein
MLAGSAWQL